MAKALQRGVDGGGGLGRGSREFVEDRFVGLGGCAGFRM